MTQHMKDCVWAQAALGKPIGRSRGYQQLIPCPSCRAKIRIERLQGHDKKCPGQAPTTARLPVRGTAGTSQPPAQARSPKPPSPASPADSSSASKYVSCPHCPAQVRRQRLANHLRNSHNGKGLSDLGANPTPASRKAGQSAKSTRRGNATRGGGQAPRQSHYSLDILDDWEMGRRGRAEADHTTFSDWRSYQGANVDIRGADGRFVAWPEHDDYGDEAFPD